GLLKPMMEKAKQQVGHYPKEALVDGAFVTAGEAAWCEQEGIVLYAPPSQQEADKLQEPAQGAAGEPRGQAKGKASKPKQLPKGQFRYVEAERAYYCPQGKRLPQVRQDTQKRTNGLELTVLVHQASGQDCQGCPRQPGCTRNPKKG